MLTSDPEPGVIWSEPMIPVVRRVLRETPAGFRFPVATPSPNGQGGETHEANSNHDPEHDPRHSEGDPLNKSVGGRGWDDEKHSCHDADGQEQDYRRPELADDVSRGIPKGTAQPS